MAPLVYMPFRFTTLLCPYSSGFTHQSCFWRLITVPRENRSARKLLKDLASPTGFEPVFTP